MHARGESADQGEVAVNALLLTRELIAWRGLCRQERSQWSQWKDQPQGELVVEEGGHRRFSVLLTSSSSFGSPNSPEGSSLSWASGASDKSRALGASSFRRCEHRELLLSFFMRFGSFVVAAGGSRMRINIGSRALILQHVTIYIPNYWIGFEFS